MSTSINTEVEEIITENKFSYGAALRMAREQKGLSVSVVSEGLHLEEVMIQALENQDLDTLPEPAYICGYIRNYARFLQMDPAPLVDDFKQSTTIDTKLSSVNKISHNLDKKQGKKTFLLMLFLLILVVVGAFGGWKLWQYNKQLKENSSSLPHSQRIKNNNNKDNFLPETSAVSDNLSNSDSIEQSYFIGNQKSTQPEKAEQISNTTTQTDKVPSNEDNTTFSVVAANQSTSISQQTPARDASLQEVTQALPENTLPPKTKTKVLDTAETPSENTQPDNKIPLDLELIFDKDSWVSIRDADDTSLLRDMIKKGRTVRLSAMPPVRMFLGDGTGVKLKVGGKDYNFGRYINRKNIARFTLEE